METENIHEINPKKKSLAYTSIGANQVVDNQSSSVNCQNQIEDEAFKVFVRVRPLNKKEYEKKHKKKHTNIVKIQDQMIFILDPDISITTNYYKEKSYVFDYIFNETDTTSFVYEKTMEPLLGNILNGYNATLFAYGMTGAGKTYTLFGDMQSDGTNLSSSDISGMIMLTFNDLFGRIANSTTQEFIIKMSYLEIYNEQVKDLLKGDSHNLMIIEDPAKGVFVADLLEIPVVSINDVVNHILVGNSRRTMASTTANQFSSRSHAIIQLSIEKKNKLKDITETVTLSKLSLIDLAGSERAAVTDNKGLRMLEGANINRSLLSLGNCINILSDQNKKGAFVPYRDSKLTRLLKDSLGGNTKTIMIACISPSYLCYEETINTLKYASRAKNIKRKIEQNAKEVELHISQYKDIIEGLKEEITNLREQLNSKSSIAGTPKIKNTIKQKDSSSDLSSDSITNDEQSESDEQDLDNSPNFKIQEISNKILENLEENWELNHNLRELNDLEYQNRQALIVLQKKIETTAETDTKRLEYLSQQISLLRLTMSNNERIKRDVENLLNRNLMKNKELKDILIKYASTSDSDEEIQLIKKLLDIENLDMYMQNVEIKREALILAKEKIIKNKQISKMEKELKIMRKKIKEKDRQLASSKEFIEKAIPKKDPKDLKETSINHIERKIKDSNYSSQAKSQNLACNNNPELIKQPSRVQVKNTILKELLVNFGQANNTEKACAYIDEKNYASKENIIKYDIQDIQPAKTYKNQNSSGYLNTSNSKCNTRQSIQTNENNISSTNLVQIVEMPNMPPLIYNKNKRKSSDRRKTIGYNSNPDSNRHLISNSHTRSTQQNSKEDTQKDSNSYSKYCSKLKNEVQNGEIQSPLKHNSIPLMSIRPFSPMENHDSINSSQNASKDCLKSKASNENSQEISLSSYSEGLTSHHIRNIEKENININNNNPGTLNIESKITSPNTYFSGQNPIKLETVNTFIVPIGNSAKATGQSKLTTPINNQQKISIDEVIAGSVAKNNLNQQQQAFNSSGSTELRGISTESIQSKLKQAFSFNLNNNNNNNQVKSVRKSSVSHFDKNPEIFLAMDLVKQKIMKSDSINPSNSISSKNINSNAALNRNLIEPSNQAETLTNYESKKVCEIRSLDQERENLKIFRNKINALIALNLNERNITNHISQELRAIIEEYKLKNYILPAKDQDSLKILTDLSNKINNIKQTKPEKDIKERCGSVNLVKNAHLEKKSSAKKKSIPINQTNNENFNRVSSSKSNIKSLMKKGSLSNLNNNYSQLYIHKTSIDNRSLNKANVQILPFKTNISFVNGEKFEVNMLDPTKNYTQKSLKNQLDTVQVLRESKSIADIGEYKTDISIYKPYEKIKSPFSIQSMMIEKSQDTLYDEIERINSQAAAQIEYSRKIDFGLHE